MLAKRHLDAAREMFERMAETQLNNIEWAAELIAQAVAERHTLYAWGGPHPSLPVQDILFRANHREERSVLTAPIAP